MKDKSRLDMLFGELLLAENTEKNYRKVLLKCAQDPQQNFVQPGNSNTVDDVKKEFEDRVKAQLRQEFFENVKSKLPKYAGVGTLVGALAFSIYNVVFGGSKDSLLKSLLIGSALGLSGGAIALLIKEYIETVKKGQSLQKGMGQISSLATAIYDLFAGGKSQAGSNKGSKSSKSQFELVKDPDLLKYVPDELPQDLLERKKSIVEDLIKDEFDPNDAKLYAELFIIKCIPGIPKEVSLKINEQLRNIWYGTQFNRLKKRRAQSNAQANDKSSSDHKDSDNPHTDQREQTNFEQDSKEEKPTGSGSTTSSNIEGTGRAEDDAEKLENATQELNRLLNDARLDNEDRVSYKPVVDPNKFRSIGNHVINFLGRKSLT